VAVEHPDALSRSGLEIEAPAIGDDPRAGIWERVVVALDIHDMASFASPGIDQLGELGDKLLIGGALNAAKAVDDVTV